MKPDELSEPIEPEQTVTISHDNKETTPPIPIPEEPSPDIPKETSSPDSIQKPAPEPPLPSAAPQPPSAPPTPPAPAIIPGQITPPIDPFLGTPKPLEPATEDATTAQSAIIGGADQPQQPTDNTPLAPIQNTVPSVNTTQITSPGRKIILIILAILFAVGIIGGVIVLLISIINGSVKYSKNDLVSTNAQHYTISHPKQWTDVTHNMKLLSQIGVLGSGLNDLKAYAYRVNLSTNTAQSVIISADQSDGISDTDLRTELQDPVAKQKITAIITPKITASDVGCSLLTNNKSSIQYNSAAYIIKENISFDCVPNASNGVKLSAEHNEGYFGVKNGYVYILIIRTAETDWNNNAAFYKNDLLPSLQPK